MTIKRSSACRVGVVALIVATLGLAGCGSAPPDQLVYNQRGKSMTDAGPAVTLNGGGIIDRDCYNRQTFVDSCSGFARNGSAL